jgi:hypothetical protein
MYYDSEITSVIRFAHCRYEYVFIAEGFLFGCRVFNFGFRIFFGVWDFGIWDLEFRVS